MNTNDRTPYFNVQSGTIIEINEKKSSMFCFCELNVKHQGKQKDTYELKLSW